MRHQCIKAETAIKAVSFTLLVHNFYKFYFAGSYLQESIVLLQNIKVVERGGEGMRH